MSDKPKDPEATSPEKDSLVTIPFAGFVSVEIDRNDRSDEQLIHDAMDLAAGVRITTPLGVYCDEWELLRKISSGNVLHVYVNEASVESNE